MDEQGRILFKYCEDRGYEVYKCYSDPGISGNNIRGRPALTQLLEDAISLRSLSYGKLTVFLEACEIY